MKRTIATVALAIIPLLMSFGAEPPTPPLLEDNARWVMIQWDPNPEPDIDHYSVHWGTNSSVYDVVFDVVGGGTETNRVNGGSNYVASVNTTNTYVRIKGFEPGVRYYFAAKAWNTGGLDSYYSDEINHLFSGTNRPPRVEGIRLVQVPTYVVEVSFSDDPGQWDTNHVLRFVLNSDRPYQFFSVTNRIELTPGIRIE